MTPKELLTVLRDGRASVMAGKIHALDVLDSIIAKIDSGDIDPVTNPVGFAVAYRRATGCSAVEAAAYAKKTATAQR